MKLYIKIVEEMFREEIWWRRCKTVAKWEDKNKITSKVKRCRIKEDEDKGYSSKKIRSRRDNKRSTTNKTKAVKDKERGAECFQIFNEGWMN